MIGISSVIALNQLCSLWLAIIKSKVYYPAQIMNALWNFDDGMKFLCQSSRQIFCKQRWQRINGRS